MGCNEQQVTLREVIVVGAGVSGSACAAALAGSGVPVLLINSALDVVGLPGYGPVVEGPWDLRAAGEASTLDEVQPALLAAWLRWASAPSPSGSREEPVGPPHGLGGPAVDAEQLAGEGELRPGGAAGTVRTPPFVVVDRRALSLDVKQVLESFPSIRMRQGLVVSVRTHSGPAVVESGDSRERGHGDHLDGGQRRFVEVETAFGEVFRGVACVVAVGLGMGGRASLGEQILEGARYGEVAADSLLHAFEEAGVPTREVEVAVGAWLSCDLMEESELEGAARGAGRPPGPRPTPGSAWWPYGGEGLWVNLHPVVEERYVCDGSPPGPQHTGQSRSADLHGPAIGVKAPREATHRGIVGASHSEPATAFVTADTASRGPQGLAGDAASPASSGCMGLVRGLFPDGAATREWYVSAELLPRFSTLPGFVVTRPSHMVSGRALAAVGEDGLLRDLPGVWAAGQAAGARSYVDSLVSGSRVATRIRAWLAALEHPDSSTRVDGSTGVTGSDPGEESAER